jgi:predicted O-linked N-acetylglucosamine transferase (SPINDLY family)
MSSKNKININIEANFEKLLQESVAFHQLGKLDLAEVGYKTLLNEAPNNSIVLSNLATIAQQRGDLESALEIYEKSLQVDQHQPNALNNYGVILQKLKRLYEAIKFYDLAISLKSEHAQAYANKANALSELKKFKEAQLNYDRAIHFKPDYPNAYFNKAKSYKEDGQIEKALITFKKAIKFNSGISYISGEILHAQMQLSIWNDFHNSIQDLIIKINASHKVILPFPLLALIDDPKLQKKASEIYANDNFPENHSLPKLERYPKHSKIRIGYFSADFKMHPVATLTAELYETHDRSQFEIHAFSFGPDNNDEMNLRIKAGVDHFHEVSSKSDKDIALLARSLEIDIAVDLGGYTADSRTGIFAMRAAPIQVNYLGYPGTMGAKYMDYIIADRTVIPKEHQKHYTEKVVYLPDSYQSNMSMLKISNENFSRNDFGLPENGFVFCCFNNDFKITPTIFQSWMRILSATEDSVLWLFEKK